MVKARIVDKDGRKCLMTINDDGSIKIVPCDEEKVETAKKKKKRDVDVEEESE